MADLDGFNAPPKSPAHIPRSSGRMRTIQRWQCYALRWSATPFGQANACQSRVEFGVTVEIGRYHEPVTIVEGPDELGITSRVVRREHPGSDRLERLG